MARAIALSAASVSVDRFIEMTSMLKTVGVTRYVYTKTGVAAFQEVEGQRVRS